MWHLRVKTCCLVYVLTLVACGYEPSFMPETQSPVVELATSDDIADARVVPNSYIVAFRSGVTGGGLHFQNYAQEYAANYMPLATTYLSDPRIKDLHFIGSLDLMRDDSPEWQADFGTPAGMQLMWSKEQMTSVPASITKVDFASEIDAAQTLAEWEAAGVIWYAEPNYLNTIDAGPFEGMSETYQNLGQSWQTQIKLGGAFDALASANKGDEVPIVAVMDSGVDYQHPLLSDQMWVNAAENQSGCENDRYGCNTTVVKKGSLGNGDVYPLLTSGPNVQCPVDANNRCLQYCCHGTHVAGIIAAKPSPESGIGGVCPICKIMAIRIVEKTGDGKGTIQDASIIAGFKYITRFRRQANSALAVRVINTSFGKFQRSKTTAAQIRVLSKVGAGTLIVGAAGNEDTMKMQYPAGYNDAIAVANLTGTGVRHQTSNYGRWVDIAAPGTAILSTVPGGALEDKTGTSMAAPVVAGVAALMLINNPTMSFNKLRTELIGSADPTIYTTNDINAQYYPKIAGEVARVPLLGSGLVNATSAVQGTRTDNLPVAASLDRVSERCGTLDLSTGERSRKVWLTLLLILLPLFIISLRANRTKMSYSDSPPKNLG